MRVRSFFAMLNKGEGLETILGQVVLRVLNALKRHVQVNIGFIILQMKEIFHPLFHN